MNSSLAPRGGPLCEILGSQRHLVVTLVVAVALSGGHVSSGFMHHWRDR